MRNEQVLESYQGVLLGTLRTGHNPINDRLCLQEGKKKITFYMWEEAKLYLEFCRGEQWFTVFINQHL